MKTPPRDVPPEARPPARWLLWASFLAPPALWFGYFMSVWVFSEGVCGATEPMGGMGGAGGKLVPLVTTVVVALLMAGLTVLSWRVRGRAARTSEVYDDFLPRVGFVTALLFALVMVAHLVQLSLVAPCG